MCAKAVGPDGNWCIDLHQRFDLNDGLRVCKAMEEYEPFFVEDPVRDENALQDIPKLRQMTTVPLTHGEEWGLKWDFNRLVENHDIDFIRSTLPNIGGITEMMKAAAICETHAVGIIPHFTGPIATAALVNCLSTFSGPVLMEYNYGGRPIDYLPECLDFKNGKAYTNQRPGLGVTARHETPDSDRRGDGAGPQEFLPAAGRVAHPLVDHGRAEALRYVYERAHHGRAVVRRYGRGDNIMKRRDALKSLSMAGGASLLAAKEPLAEALGLPAPCIRATRRRWPARRRSRSATSRRS